MHLIEWVRPLTNFLMRTAGIYVAGVSGFSQNGDASRIVIEDKQIRWEWVLHDPPPSQEAENSTLGRLRCESELK